MIINISLGTNIYSAEQTDAVRYALSKGCIIVASAGNSNEKALQYPACIPGVINVGACDKTNNKSYISNYGTSLKLLAPGSFINGAYLKNESKLGSGTSVSTPIISGLCAIVMENYPYLTNYQVERSLYLSCIDLTKGTYKYNKGRDIYSGFGAVNAYSMFNTAQILSNENLFPKKSDIAIIQDYQWYTEAYLFINNMFSNDYDPKEIIKYKNFLDIMGKYGKLESK